MKKNITLVTFSLLFVCNLFAQKELDSLTFDNTQDINFFRNIKNNSQVKKYITANQNVVKIGDTMILGNPTSQELNSRTYSGNYGIRARGGVANTRSTTSKTYDFIKMGRPAGIGSIMTAMSGDAQIMASNRFKNTKVVVSEMKTYHRGSKKNALAVLNL